MLKGFHHIYLQHMFNIRCCPPVILQVKSTCCSQLEKCTCFYLLVLIKFHTLNNMQLLGSEYHSSIAAL